MSCRRPLDPDTLVDYWLAALPGAEEAAVEEHLFACDACGAELRALAAIVEGVRALARAGTLRLVVDEAFLGRAAEEGLRVRQYTLAPGGAVQCTVSAEDDLLVARLAADLRGAAQVDLALCDAGGVERLRLRDIPVSADAREVIYQESMAFARAAATQTLRVRLLGVGEAGESVLAEYRFDHTRTLPGTGVDLFGDGSGG